MPEKGILAQQSGQNFHLIFDNMLEGVQILDHDWRYVYLNTAAERHSRLPNQELLGRNFIEMWPGIESTHLFALMKRCLESRIPARLENRFVYPDGAVKFGEFSLAWVGLLDEASGDILPEAACGLDVNNWPFPIFNIHQGNYQDGLSAVAVRTSEVVTSRDVQTDTRAQPMHSFIEKLDLHSLAAVPISKRSKTIGVLNMVSPQAGLFDADEEVRLLEEMGQDISFALDIIETESEKAAAEKTLRQWADAFEHCAHGIAIGLPSSGRILTCNPALRACRDARSRKLHPCRS